MKIYIKYRSIHVYVNGTFLFEMWKMIFNVKSFLNFSCSNKVSIFTLDKVLSKGMDKHIIHFVKKKIPV